MLFSPDARSVSNFDIESLPANLYYVPAYVR
jgi:hypothetical protein